MSLLLLSLSNMRCYAFQQGRYLEILLSLLWDRGARMYMLQWDPWAIEVSSYVLQLNIVCVSFIYIYIDLVVVAGALLIPHVPHERSHGREQHACQSRLPQ